MSESSTILDVLTGRAQWAVVCADNRTAMAALPSSSIDHVITDPPYSAHVHDVGQIHKPQVGKPGRKAGQGSGESFGFDALSPVDLETLAEAAARIAKRWTLIFCDLEGADAWRRALREKGLPPIRQGLWVKPDAMPQLTGDRPANGAEAIVIAHPPGKKRWNGGGTSAVWTHCIERTDRAHPTQKPLPLLLELVDLFTEAGELVIDPFCGSGTTGAACVRLGRRFIGVEKDPKHAATARERLAAEVQGLSLTSARAGQLGLFA